MSSIRHKPTFLDRVWVERRFTQQGKQPNGYIKKVFWVDEEVLVWYLVDIGEPREFDTFTFDELYGNWNSRYKLYFIHDDD